MNELSIIQVTPENLEQLIKRVVKSELASFLELFKSKTQDELLTPKQVAKLLKVNVSTIHRRTEKGILNKYGNGGGVYYKKNEVEDAIVKLNS
ncbi:helix-turn-helix domain-containing protein [Polaribacter atrinae]|uniref:helix-turn-helix domain-containing protein n=1 Tax=Polaribacter atrinae TaxID=1333662 RepID=UPI002493B835|nr:helix-turn-helix domain-containing protein [Polaribacter atrinae]